MAIEPELRAVQQARELGFEVEHGFFPVDLHTHGPFDLVVFNDVFEHLPEPVESLQAARDLLSADGLLILNLPSSDGAVYRIANLLDRVGISAPLDRLWQRGLSSPHLTYFNPRNLRRFVTSHSDLKIVRQRSLKALTREGLRERVNSTVAGPAGWLVYAALSIGASLIERMPPDIQFMVASRRGGTPTLPKHKPPTPEVVPKERQKGRNS